MDYSTSSDIEYQCDTQKSNLPIIGVAPTSHHGNSNTPTIVLGYGPIVPRWDVSNKNTKLQYFVQTDTFPTTEDAMYAAVAFQQAAEDWNILAIGVTISQTTVQASANFNFVYKINEPNKPWTLASAFFPHELNQDVIVRSHSFTANNKPFMKNFFLHEIGHILGLRHEFALTQPDELKSHAVQFRGANDQSVMSYVFPPTMQSSDRDGVQRFYKLHNGDMIDDVPVTDYVPQIRKMK